MAELNKAGILTDEEFAAEKAKILNPDSVAKPRRRVASGASLCSMSRPANRLSVIASEAMDACHRPRSWPLSTA